LKKTDYKKVIDGILNSLKSLTGERGTVPILKLIRLAKEFGKDHDLALRLWEIGTRETRILASMVAVPEEITEEQMEAWVRDFDN